MYEQIKIALERAKSDKTFVAELHLQILKYAEELKHVSGIGFCKELSISNAYKTEFSKMLKIYPRLISAGLDKEKI